MKEIIEYLKEKDEIIDVLTKKIFMLNKEISDLRSEQIAIGEYLEKKGLGLIITKNKVEEGNSND